MTYKVESSVVLRESYFSDALSAVVNDVALQMATKKGFSGCSDIFQALDALGMKYERGGGAVEGIYYCKSELCWGDASVSLWRVLAPFVEPESRWQREDECGEVTYVYFEGGEAKLEVGLSAQEIAAREARMKPEERLFYSIKQVGQDIRPAIQSVLASVGHLDFKDDGGNTPLMVACQNAGDGSWHLDCAMELLKHGSDLNCVNRYGETPLFIAVCSEQLQLVQGFFENYSLDERAVNEAIYAAAQRVSLPLMEFLVSRGGSPAHAEVLALACMSPSPKRGLRKPLVELLVEKCGCDVNELTSVSLHAFGTRVLEAGATPLMAAVFNGEGDLVEYLLSKGASALTADSKGTTALHYISGPQWDASREGALAWSPKKDALEIGRLLLQAGANPDAPNMKGITSRDLARQHFPEILSIFDCA